MLDLKLALFSKWGSQIYSLFSGHLSGFFFCNVYS